MKSDIHPKYVKCKVTCACGNVFECESTAPAVNVGICSKCHPFFTGKQKMVEHKLFPGYVLVKMVMNDDTWYVVRNTRGCTGFVGPASKPVPLTAEEVEKMGVEKAAPLSVDFAVGDTVQITAGPLEGFMGLVEEIDTESFKVKLKVNMFGRETPAEVEIGQVELP